MSKMKTKLELAQKQTEIAVDKTNKKIEELGGYTSTLYVRLKAIQDQFNRISNVPRELRIECEKLQKVSLEWKQQVEKIEKDYDAAKIKAGSDGIAGVGIGGAVVALGPTAAMGAATTFGVASTGTAISSLSGAAATNAALAWLGGGALAAGGGGMVAGEAFLALAGPIGWTIAGISILASAFSIFNAKFDKEKLEAIFCLISKRDEKKYDLAIVELNERIKRIIDESDKLRIALDRTKSLGTDYISMTNEQQLELGSYVNFMNSSTQLLVNPTLGLQPDYTESDLKTYISNSPKSEADFCNEHKDLMISMCNLLYKIELDETDVKLLNKSFENNKKFLESANINKKEFADNEVVDKACQALKLKYKKEHGNMNNGGFFDNILGRSFSDDTNKKNEFQEKLEKVARDVENSDMSDEEKRKMLLSLTQLKEERIHLMITGCTGCGKSSTINALFNAEKAKVGTGADPETMDIQCYNLNNLILWDSPGLGDGEAADKRHKENIIKKLKEKNSRGQLLIDLVLVIVDGSNRDMGTTYSLINDVIIPNLGENPQKRIIIAINKADALKQGRNNGWDYEQSCPKPELIPELNKKAESVRKRIKESTGVDVETIYYSAGYKEEGEPQEPSYNLLKLLLYILRFTPDNKRVILMDNINRENEQNSFASNDERQEQITEKIAKELSRSDIFKQCLSSSSSIGAEIGSSLLGVPGKVVGTVLGGAVGLVRGIGKALFGKKK